MVMISEQESQLGEPDSDFRLNPGMTTANTRKGLEWLLYQPLLSIAVGDITQRL